MPRLLTPAMPALIGCLTASTILGQDLEVESLHIPAGDGLTLEATFGRLRVPEVRSDPSSGTIELSFVRIKSPDAPDDSPTTLYLEGSTRLARREPAMAMMARYLDAGDMIFLDQRGRPSSSPSLSMAAPAQFAPDVFETRDGFVRGVSGAMTEARAHWESQGVDLRGYITEEIADDIADIARALDIDTLSLIGFSQNTQTGFSVIKRHPELVARAVLLGVEGPDCSRKFPHVFDRQIAKISAIMASDPSFGPNAPDFETLIGRAIEQLERDPIVYGNLNNGATQRGVRVGPFGFQLIVMGDLGDTKDIPILPRLAHEVAQGDANLLRHFVWKRTAQMARMPIWFWTMDASADAAPERWAKINREAKTALLGNVMNLAHPEIDDVLGVPDAPPEYRQSPSGSMPVLFFSGTLDSNTPPEQGERLRKGFPDSAHVIIENAGHEDYLFNPEVQNLIYRFLMGETIEDHRLRMDPPRMIPLDGSADGFNHEALRAER